MKKFRLWLLVSVVAIGIVAIAAGYRAVTLLRYPLGSGQYDLSPDGRFEARASNMTDKSFWGGQRHYYQFEIIDVTTKERLRTVTMGFPDGEPAVVYRGPKVIKWAADSSSVTIPIGQDLELTIEMP